MQATAGISHRQTTAKECRWLASMEAESRQVRKKFHKQVEALRGQIAKLEECRKLDMEQLEKGNDEDDCPVVERRWDVPPDYQPTECGDE